MVIDVHETQPYATDDSDTLAWQMPERLQASSSLGAPLASSCQKQTLVQTQDSKSKELEVPMGPIEARRVCRGPCA
jgi:hypothetical protein